MKALLCSLTVSFFALHSQVASAEPSADSSGPTFGLSPLGVAVGDLSGVTGALHLGWRFNSKLVIQFEMEGIISPRGAKAAHTGNNGLMSSASNEDIAGIGTRWWPGKDTWTSATVGIGKLYGGQAPEARGPALLLRAGHRLGQHTSLVVSARAVDYDDLSSAVGAGLEFEWGSPTR